MSLRRFRCRLKISARRLRDQAYTRVAALWSGPPGPEEQAESVRLFGWLAEEAAAGTPVEALLGRLPAGMALAIRHGLAALLAADGQPRPP